MTPLRLLLVLFILTLSGLSASPAAEDKALPHIVLLMGDDHGWEETGYNGHPHVKTPVLDEMAATGLRLDRFHSGHSVCSPTRGSFLTGRHPNRYGVFSAGWSMRPEEITIAQLLGEVGYRSAHFGKWHVGAVKRGSPLNPGAMGFDEWLSHDNFFEMDPPLSRNGAPPEIHHGESSEVLVEEAKKFLGKAALAEDKPTLTVIWFGSPHEPYSGLPDDLALYDDLPEKYADRPKSRLTSNETGRQVERPLGEVLRERYAEITAMDRAIGSLRDFLEEKGLRDNTLFWYCGDNGTSRDAVLASPWRGHKAQNYDGGLRVPGLVEWPARIPEHRVSGVNSVTSDILPTLCEIVGTAPPGDRPLDGISLVPLFEGRMEKRPQPMHFWNYNHRTGVRKGAEPWIDPGLQEGTTPLVKLMGDIATRNFKNFRHPDIRETDYRGSRSIVGNRYKLIVHDGKDPEEPARVELFDIRKDPAEEKDLAGEMPEKAEELGKELRAWQDSVLESLTGADYED